MTFEQKTLCPPEHEYSEHSFPHNTLSIDDDERVRGSVITDTFGYQGEIVYVEGRVQSAGGDPAHDSTARYAVVINVVREDGTIVLQDVPHIVDHPTTAIENCYDSVQNTYELYNTNYL